MKQIRLLLAILLAFVGVSSVKAETKEAYAVLSTDGTTLTFYYDTNLDERIDQFGESNVSHDWEMEWYDLLEEPFPKWIFYNTERDDWYNEITKTVVFDESFGQYYGLMKTRRMFYHMKELTTIIGLEYLKTDNASDMSSMFNGCSGLTSLDLSGLNTSKVTSMNYMFSGCSGLKTIFCNDNWQKSGLSSLGMFSGCTNLKGGNETVYSADHVDANYANPTEGYFTIKIEPYAVLSDNGRNLTFYYDTEKSLHKMEVGEDNVFEVTCGDGLFDYPGWTSSRGNATIKNVMFDDSFADCEELTSMRRMFFGCSGLTSLDLSKLNTSNVTDMAEMFRDCSGFTSLDLNGLNTSNVTNMGGMFQNCTTLTSLDLNGLNTSNVTDMLSMFNGCSGLTSLDLSELNTSNVVNMGYMFNSCNNLKELNLRGNFNTSNVTNMSSMFYDCSSLTSLDLSNFNTENVTETPSMFVYCNKISNLKISSTMGNLTYGGIGSDLKPCKIVAPSGFDFGTDTSGDYFLWNSGYFTLKDEEAYAVLSDDDATLTFYYDPHKAYYISEVEGSKVYDIPWPWDEEHDEGNPPSWEDNFSITTVTFDASFAGYDRMQRTTYMFKGLHSLETINNLEYLNTENVRDMGNMFHGCERLKVLDLSSFDVSKVTNMSGMFSYCDGLKTLDLSNFDVSKVTDMDYMFSNCTNLETIFCAESANWENVSKTSSMFSGCKKLSGKYAGGNFVWTSNATDKTYAKVCKNGQDGYFTYIDNLDGQSVTLNADGYATYASSIPMDFTNASGYTAWKITGIEGETITFEQITGSVAAGTGVLLMGGANAQVTIHFSTYGDAHSDNMLVGFTTATSIASNEYYGLSGNQFVKVNDGTVPAGKALLPIEGNTVKSLNLVFNDETGIIETQTVNAEQATGIFNLAGQRLEKPQRGINIVNGKKMLVK